MIPAIRVAAIAAAAAIAAVLGFPAFLALRSGGTKVFEPQAFDFALLAVGLFLVVAGAQIVPWRAALYIGLLAAVAAAALLFGMFAIVSIGLVVVPVGVVLTLLLYRGLRRRPGRETQSAALGGAVIGYGLVLAYIALIVPATVECFPNGGATASGRWGGAGSQQISGSGSVSADGVVSGSIETPTSIATYRCEQGRVVEFHRALR